MLAPFDKKFWTSICGHVIIWVLNLDFSPIWQIPFNFSHIPTPLEMLVQLINTIDDTFYSRPNHYRKIKEHLGVPNLVLKSRNFKNVARKFDPDLISH